jgi:glycosyltransferase involved in cell wall biosynthesis
VKADPGARPIRVLLVAPSLEILGGQAVQASRLLELIRRDPRIRIEHHPINPPLPRLLQPLRRVPYVRTLTNFLAYLTGLVRKVPGHDIVHVFTAAYTSFLFWTVPAALLARLLGKKLIINYRDGQAEDHLKHWRTAMPTLRLAHVIVAPSGFLVDVFGRFGIRARCIFNVIDRSRFRYRPRRELRPVFLHNRILEPLYNIECTLRAFSEIQERYPDAQLTIAHDGPSRGSLEQYARDLGLRNTRFIGRVPHEGIAALYDSVDIYLTSPDFDCMPGSILECFSSGLPVVATNAGGIPYIAENERTALLVPRGDSHAMAEAVFRLMRDPDLVERLTANAREAVLRYDGTAVCAAWCELYCELADRKLASVSSQLTAAS